MTQKSHSKVTNQEQQAEMPPSPLIFLFFTSKGLLIGRFWSAADLKAIHSTIFGGSRQSEVKTGRGEELWAAAGEQQQSFYTGFLKQQ